MKTNQSVNKKKKKYPVSPMKTKKQSSNSKTNKKPVSNEYQTMERLRTKNPGVPSTHFRQTSKENSPSTSLWNRFSLFIIPFFFPQETQPR